MRNTRNHDSTQVEIFLKNIFCCPARSGKKNPPYRTSRILINFGSSSSSSGEILVVNDTTQLNRIGVLHNTTTKNAINHTFSLLHYILSVVTWHVHRYCFSFVLSSFWFFELVYVLPFLCRRQVCTGHRPCIRQEPSSCTFCRVLPF